MKDDPPEKTAAMEKALAAFGVKHRREIKTLDEATRVKARAAHRAVNEEFPGPNVRDFVDHIDHAVKLIGIEHVGIASDFDGGGGVAGWRDASQTLNVTTELVRRGYSRDDIRKLWGANALRVWREAERVAARMKNDSVSMDD
ncbi:MAG: membrane dipeptidase [Planctomycetota bacterium]